MRFQISNLDETKLEVIDISVIQQRVGRAPFAMSNESTILESRIDLGTVELDIGDEILGVTGEDNIFVISGKRSGFFKIRICTIEPDDFEEREFYSSIRDVSESLNLGNIHLEMEYINPVDGVVSTKAAQVGNIETISKDFLCDYRREVRL